MNSNTPTPETDAELINGYRFSDAPDANRYINADFARKLEAERDQLRKVCGELYEGIGCGCGGEYGLCNRCCEIGAAYNQLPHVKREA